MVEHFPKNNNQRGLFEAQFIGPIDCIETKCAISHIQSHEKTKANPRYPAELIKLNRD